MLIQPFIENAIVHGLLHKEGKKVLKVTFTLAGSLVCRIEDNGVGREASAKVNKNALSSHKSHGIKVTEERLQILNQVYNVDASVKILDLVTPDNRPGGTQVTLRMKIKRS